MENIKASNNDNSFVIWLTGLSGSGKTTIAKRLYSELARKNRKVERLDGDVIRGLFPSTGFSKQDRDDHIKRIGFMASRLENHGVAVIASFISPYTETRNFVRDMCRNFIEVYVSAPLSVCEKRDVKGLYKKARAGEIENFTGIDDPYEAPDKPEIIIDSEKETVEESVSKILKYIEENIER